MFLAVGVVSRLGVTVGRVFITLFTLSIGVFLLWSVLAISCSSPPLHVINLLYNFIDLGYNKLHS